MSVLLIFLKSQSVFIEPVSPQVALLGMRYFMAAVYAPARDLIKDTLLL